MTFKKISAKSAHPVPNERDFKIAPPKFSFVFITSQSLIDFTNFKDFSKNSNPDFFLVFEDIHPIFCTVTHTNNLIRWYDVHDDQTCLRLSTSCGS